MTIKKNNPAVTKIKKPIFPMSKAAGHFLGKTVKDRDLKNYNLRT